MSDTLPLDMMREEMRRIIKEHVYMEIKKADEDKHTIYPVGPYMRRK